MIRNSSARGSGAAKGLARLPFRRSPGLHRAPRTLRGGKGRVGTGPSRTHRRGPLVGAAGVILAAGLSIAAWLSDGAAPSTAVAHVPRLSVVDPGRSTPGLWPGAVVTGSVYIMNSGGEPREVADVTFTPPVSDACRSTGVSLAPTLPPTPDTPLVVPAEGSTVVGWTAYMDGDGDHACQGATLTSQVTLDGEPTGAVTLVAGRLEQPPAPTGGLTTSTRAAVHWSASAAADPGWVVERALAGTDDWQPACGSSPARPVRSLACTDTGLAGSTAYTYRVHLRSGHWHTTSRPSGPVTTQERLSP